MKKNLPGFTLIELLVVISIIGILSTLLLANYNATRGRARDAQRKSDIREIQTALELFKNSRTPPFYPNSAMGFDAVATILQNEGFMKKVPHDSKYVASCTDNCWPDYSYTRDPGGTGDLLAYKLVACLENASDPQKDSGLASQCTGEPASYTRTEP